MTATDRAPPPAGTPAQWAVRWHGVAVFVLLCGSVPLLHAAQHWLLGRDEPIVRTASTRARPAFDAAALLDGTLQQQLQVWLQEDSPVTFTLRGMLRETQAAFGLLQTDRIHVGPQGWLFQRPTLAPDPGLLQGLAAGRRALFSAARREADELGLVLVAALVPDKVRVYPEQAFRNVELPPQKQGVYALLQQELREAGIAAPDLDASLSAARRMLPDPLYHPWDTHWTPRGALVAAQAIAALLQQEWPDRLGPALPLELSGPSVIEVLPDLVAQTGIRAERVYLAATDTWIDRPGSRAALRWLSPMQYYGLVCRDPATGQLRDLDELQATARVAVAGSSFSRTHGATALAYALQRPVDRRWSRSGAVSVVALQELFDRVRAGAVQPRVVVWEFPERAATEGLGADPWRR